MESEVVFLFRLFFCFCFFRGVNTRSQLSLSVLTSPLHHKTSVPALKQTQCADAGSGDCLTLNTVSVDNRLSTVDERTCRIRIIVMLHQQTGPNPLLCHHGLL